MTVASMDFEIVRPEDIIIPPDRQRREITTEDLEASISYVLPSGSRRGIINPLVITRDLTLVAGERRLRAALALALPLVPVRFIEDLPVSERKLLELEENLRRKDLTWTEKALAFAEMFSLYRASTGGDQAAFAKSIGYNAGYVSDNLKVAKELQNGKLAISTAPTLRQAANKVRREADRETANILADVFDTVVGADAVPPQAPAPPPESVLNLDFLQWASTYTGPKFNLLHCDLPYGLDLQDSAQLQHGFADRHQVYEDDEATYWRLLHGLIDNAPRLLSSSCHVYFWFSFRKKLHARTLAVLDDRWPELVLDHTPLVWLKTDNRGIAPDVERQPRNITEFCLFGRIGDRKNVKLIANAYGAPKGSGFHPSEKPVPVLKHFLSMTVDENTRMLDPTCGSGTSLRAAEALGASQVLGLELDQGFADAAAAELRKDRNLRKMEQGK